MGWVFSLQDVLEAVAAAYRSRGLEISPETVEAARTFAEERLESLLTEAGMPTLAVRAAMSAPSVYAKMLRARLIYELMQRPEFAELTRLYKRAANLASQSKHSGGPSPDLFTTSEEDKLYEAFLRAAEATDLFLMRGAELLPPWDPAAPLPKADLTSLEAPLTQILALADALDPFMDNVLVMVEDEEVRENRLALLRRVRNALALLGRLEMLGA